MSVITRVQTGSTVFYSPSSASRSPFSTSPTSTSSLSDRPSSRLLRQLSKCKTVPTSVCIGANDYEHDQCAPSRPDPAASIPPPRVVVAGPHAERYALCGKVSPSVYPYAQGTAASGRKEARLAGSPAEEAAVGRGRSAVELKKVAVVSSEGGDEGWETANSRGKGNGRGEKRPGSGGMPKAEQVEGVSLFSSYLSSSSSSP